MVLPFCLFTFLPLSAQTFTERIQKSAAGQASVVIHQDAEIDKLVNSATLGNTTPRPAATTTPSPTANHSATTPSSSATAGKPTPSEKPAEANDTVDLHKKLMRGGVKVNGYRVQAFAGGNSRKDRLQAEQVGNNIKAHYANVPVYVHFYSPRWICRVGNYRTYEEAHQMLQSLRKLGYSQASIVRGKITVQY
ncbi:MAG: SPOR domain-containing protein [Prevotella sp.]|nr:SPOR domain-containing protein [Prevotella sp.]